MKRLLRAAFVCSILILSICSQGLADYKVDIEKADALYQAGKLNEAADAFNTIIIENPGADPVVLCYAQRMLGYSLSNISEKTAAFVKADENYPFDAAVASGKVRLIISRLLLEAGMSNQAKDSFNQVINEYPNARITERIKALKQIQAICLRANNNVDWQTTLISFIKKYAAQLDLSTMTWALDSVNLERLSIEEYQAFLEHLLCVIPAKEENTQILGRIKSELEKVK